MKLLEQLSLNIPSYPAIILTWLGISSAILACLMVFDEGDLLH